MSRSGFSKSVLFLAILLLTAIMTLSCGSGGGDDDGGTASVTTAITMEATPQSIEAIPGRSCAIKATMTASAGTPVPVGTYVTFATTLGSFALSGGQQIQGKTVDDTGVVSVSLIAGSEPGTAEVTAKSGGVSQQISVTFIGSAMPASLSIRSSHTSVKSDNSDSATITATVRDAANGAVPGITVSFSTTGGLLSASSAETNDQGEASVTLRAGDEKQNGFVTVSARVASLPSQSVPVRIEGTTVELLPDPFPDIRVGGEAVTLRVTVTDSGGRGVYNAAVMLTAEPAGKVSLSGTSGNTDPEGRLEIEVSPVASGTVTLTAESLGAGASVTFHVINAALEFGILKPTDDPHYLPRSNDYLTVSPTPQDLYIEVNAPTQSRVQFAATMGRLWRTGGGDSGSSITVDVSGGRAWSYFRSVEAGTATIQVFDADNPTVSDSLRVIVYPSPADAARMSLQASSTVVAPSSGDLANTVTLRVTVESAMGQIVPNVPILFSIENATGGGEFIAPVIAYTGALTKPSNGSPNPDAGVAVATFTSGSRSSGSRGVTVVAAVAGNPAVNDSETIIIGGTAGAIVITRGTTIESIQDDTMYRLPMAVQLIDTNGNPYPNGLVTLNLWPVRYATGYWEEYEENKCRPFVECIQPNEDVNRTLWLDDGEDTNADGRLTPPLSAAGSVPATVTTDANGVAEFDLIYPKASAVWIEDALTASTLVFGSENRTTYTFWLPYLKEEACFLPHSPYKTKYLILTASRYELPADICSEATLWAHVYTAKDEPVEDGELVAFTLLTNIGGIQDPVVPTVGGLATTTYTAGYLPESPTADDENVKIKAELIGSPCTTDTITLKLFQVDRPEASFEIDYLETVGANLKFLFRDTSTTEAGHIILSRTWTFYGLGGPPPTETTAEVEFLYPKPALDSSATYTTRLDIQDDRGFTDTAIRKVTLKTDNIGNVSWEIEGEEE